MSVWAVFESGTIEGSLSIASSLGGPGRVGGVLDVTSPFLLTCCGLGVEDSRGCCRLVEGFGSAFGGGLLGFLDSSLSVVVGTLASAWGAGSFCGGVFRVGEAFTLFPSFVF